MVLESRVPRVAKYSNPESPLESLPPAPDRRQAPKSAKFSPRASRRAPLFCRASRRGRGPPGLPARFVSNIFEKGARGSKPLPVSHTVACLLCASCTPVTLSQCQPLASRSQAARQPLASRSPAARQPLASRSQAARQPHASRSQAGCVYGVLLTCVGCRCGLDTSGLVH